MTFEDSSDVSECLNTRPLQSNVPMKYPMIREVYEDDAAPLLPKGTIVHLMGFLDTTANNKNPADPRNWAGGGRRSIANMFIDLGYSVALTEEQFQAEMAKRRAKMKSRNDYDIGCPLCWAPPVPPAPAAQPAGGQ